MKKKHKKAIYKQLEARALEYLRSCNELVTDYWSERNLEKLEHLVGIITPVKGAPFSSLGYRLGRALLTLELQKKVRPLTRNEARLLNPPLPPPSKKPKEKSNQGKDRTSKINEFYRSYAWRKVRYQVLLKWGRTCMACGRVGGEIHVDHIKPLRKNWGRRLDIENLQVLCGLCNHGKGNWDETDWRPTKKD